MTTSPQFRKHSPRWPTAIAEFRSRNSTATFANGTTCQASYESNASHRRAARTDVDDIFNWLVHRSVRGAISWYLAFGRAVKPRQRFLPRPPNRGSYVAHFVNRCSRHVAVESTVLCSN